MCMANTVKRAKERNPDAAKAYAAAQYRKHRERALARGRQRRLENIEKERARGLAYYHANKEACRVRHTEYRLKNIEKERSRNRKKRQEQHERIAAYNRDYKAKNRALYAHCQKAREQRLRRAMPSWADEAAIAEIYQEARRLTIETGIKHEVDHIIPLQGKTVSGLHVVNNLQILTKAANVKKGNRLDHLAEAA